MAEPLRLLLAEDSDNDAALVLRAVERAGFDLTVHRVDTGPAFAAALAGGDWDAIISDHAMPQFSSVEALALLQADGRDLPFLVVSGTIDEEAAVLLLRTGAHDFVTKQNLARLGPALKRELKDAQNRAAHRASQEDLRRQHDFMRLVIDSSPTLVFVKDHLGRFALANRATAELYQTTVDALVEGIDIPAASALGNAGAHGRRIEAVADPRTGDTRWFDVISVPLPGDSGAPRNLVIASDITEQKRTADTLAATQAQLMHAQKMEAMGQLASGIAHDFNNLLTVILGFGAMALERAQHQPELAAELAEVIGSGQRASLLTRQLLSFSRKQLVDLKALDLNAIVSDMTKLLERVIGEHVELNVNLAPSVSRVSADPSQIEQVIVNLAVNARDAMPDGGTLTIETVERAPLVEIRVRDTGSGIPADVQARMFEPFFTTKVDGKGTGLGLSTVYGIVKQCGGDISVESVLGRGTTFVVSLPACALPVPVANIQTAGTPAGGEVILLVEDEAAIRHLVDRTLARNGYRVLRAATAIEASEVAQQYEGAIDLLLTDIVMPGVRGPALATMLHETRPHMAVLYMSGFMSDADDVEAIESAANLLRKPFTPSVLTDKVRQCLNQRHRKRSA
jgi:signal transduction histidine kinase